MAAVFRKRSLIVHPDKNRDNRELAEQAFQYLKHAFNQLTEYEGAFNAYARICSDAEAKIMHEDHKRQKRAARERRPPSPFDLASAITVETCNRIADAEAERIVAMKIKETKDALQKEDADRIKRKRTAEKAFEQEWEKGRDTRVDSWREFTKKKRKLGGRKETPRIESRSVVDVVGFARTPEPEEDGAGDAAAAAPAEPQ